MINQSLAGTTELSSVFYNGFNSDYILNNFEGIQTCELSCNQNNSCLGYVWYEDDVGYCNTLTNISGFTETNLTSESYRKILFHHPPR